MKEDYTKYTSKELLDDDYFIHSMIQPTPESIEFWNSLIINDVVDYEEFKKAEAFVLLMRRPKKIMTAKERNEMWINIEIRNKQNLRKNIRKKQLYLWGAVASFFLVLSALSFFFYKQTMPVTLDFQEIMAGMQDVAESKDIQLILSDNKTIELEETSVEIEVNKEGEVLVNSKQMAVNSKQMAETVAPEKEEEISYNQLIVPLGRHSRLTLPDGTKMHINAGTKVIFPDRFKKKEREIFVDGEVYLEVAENKKVPFFVHTATMDVKVLGTVFNIRAYKEDKDQEVVLVTGSVQVTTKDKHEAMLSPNQKLGYSEGKCHISGINAHDYVSWINGYFIYKKEPLLNIMKHISRYYGIEVVCGEKINSLTCSGKLDLKENLDIVMKDLAQILTLEIKKNENTYHIN
ncbi:FecR family protein [Bacteroides sp. 519]|uniref:FecR family protein n=1 Tax=Bacteroides sp. 519 TaxID=2302937 RepID=UPI0013D09078|nr:FecR family protein [Bacteroides sp. 519]NDV60668.1 FecR family protein [Bacteroides sp. 519]